MRASQFAVFADYGSSTIAFNTLTREFLRFEIDHSQLQRDLLEDSLPAEVHTALKDGRFIVEDDYDEYEDFVVTYRQDRYGPQPLVAYITPTLKCNASCEYCFQRDIRPGRPAERGPSEDKVVLFLATKLQEATGLKITWFGGEPLLRMVYIDHLSRELMRLCNLAGKPYSASMVTNGMFLDDANVAMLLRSQIRRLQISLDGPEALHNAIGRRDATRGFRDIVNSVARLPEEMQVALRVNVSRKNVGSIPDLLDDLAHSGVAKPNVTIYFPLIYDFSIGNADTEYQNNDGGVLPNEAYGRLQLRLMAYADSLGFNTLIEDILIPGAPQCHAIRSKGYSIWPDGAVTRCIHDVTTPENVNIADPDLDVGRQPSMRRWVTEEVFSDGPCRTCFFLPMCGGSCVHSRFAGIKPPQSCPPSKWTLKERMRWYESSFTGESNKIDADRQRLVTDLQSLALRQDATQAWQPLLRK